MLMMLNWLGVFGLDGRNVRPLMLMMLDWLGGLWPRWEKHTAADAHDAQLVRGLWPGWEKRTTADAHDARLVGGSLARIGENAGPLVLMMLDWLGGLWPGWEKRTAADAHDA